LLRTVIERFGVVLQFGEENAMRALRVLGLDDGAQGAGTNLVCEDAASGEQFFIPCDDRLRAGARGDLSRLGQLEIELESQLRPRDIQARIRAGASVDEVALVAGTTSTRVERFAYPVLLERASMAERARKARPTIDGITAGVSVQDTVAATLAARGHDGEVSWDAFKDEKGWVLRLRWNAGRSENSAHWQFHPGPDWGTLSARDEAAAEIVDPALRILRPLRPIRADAASTMLLDPTAPTGSPASRSSHPAGSKLPTAQTARFGGSSTSGSMERAATAARTADLVERTITDERTGVNPVAVRAQVARTGTDSSGRSMPLVAEQTTALTPNSPATPAMPAIAAARATAAAPAIAAAPAPTAARATAAPASTLPAVSPATPKGRGATGRPAAPVRPSLPSAAGSRAADRGVPAGGGTPAEPVASSKSTKRGQRPAMPSWEDVLLGTRSSGR